MATVNAPADGLSPLAMIADEREFTSRRRSPLPSHEEIVAKTRVLER
jgi:hypothetical protein